MPTLIDPLTWAPTLAEFERGQAAERLRAYLNTPEGRAETQELAKALQRGYVLNRLDSEAVTNQPGDPEAW